MTITTSRNLTYAVNWIDNPLTEPDKLMLQFDDERPLAEIVPEFDGLVRIDRVDEHQGDKRFDGYDSLTGARRMPNGSVLLTLEREGEP